MSDAASKERSSAPGGFREVVGFGKALDAGGGAAARSGGRRRTRFTARTLRMPRLPRPSYRKLMRYAIQFAGQLKSDGVLFPHIRSDLRAFREDLLLVVKKQFPLKAGRPSDPLIDKACELVRRGKSVMRVLREQIKDWDTLDAYTRYLAAKGLRQAVARRERQRKR